MSKAIAEIATGVAVVALAVVAPFAAIPLISGLSSGALLGIGATGASLVLGGVGTLLTKQMAGLQASVRNPIQPRNVIYGQALIGGTVVFLLETGESDKFLHTIYVLACHPCQSIDAVMFDGKRVPLDGSGNSISFQDSTSVIGTQQTVNIASITRAGDVVTVVMASAMPLPAGTIVSAPLATGDSIAITGVSTDATLNGIYQITLVDDTTFTYVSGGTAVSISGEGFVTTTWPDYGDTVHAEFASGTQTSNPFPGLEASDDTGSRGLWTSAHALRGHCAVYLRLKYGGETYASGLPVINFVVSGKNDIYDPRTGTTGYTTNAALCIADYLAHPTWGFNAAYTSEIPIGPLMAAANICDEGVALAAGGTEPRYTCNGSFQLSAKRSEVLQNLLTSCAGRLTYVGGQFFINPAAWIGTSVMMGGTALINEAGSVATSGTLTVWSEYIDTASGGIASAGISFGRIEAGDPWGISGTGTIVRTNTPYGRRSDSVTLSADSLRTNLSVNCFIFPDLATPPGGFATYSPAPNLRIYDVYIDAHFADGSDSRLRPSLHGVINFGGGNPQFGSFTDPELALDADATPPVTYANYVRPFFNQNYFANSPPNVLTYSMFGAISVTAEPVTTALTFAAGPFQWKPKLASRDLYNGIRATYISPANNWQSTDMPPYAQDEIHGYDSDANLDADGGERRFKDIQLPFTKSVSIAQRLAKIELLRSRQQGTGTFAYNVAMYQVTVLDVIAMDLPYLGWTAKLLEVTAHRFTVNRSGEGAGAILGTEIDVQETDPSIYDWSATEELAAGGNSQSVVGPSTVSAPSGGTATTGSGVAANVGGVEQSRVKVCWSAPTDGYVINGGSVIVQYTETASPLGNWLAVGTFDASTSCAYLPSVSDGTSYTVRIAYMSAQGIQSDWTILSPVVASGSTSLHWAYNETPSGTINGTNVTFTLAHTPNPANSLKLFLNGYQLVYGVDFTLSGSTITMVNIIPKTGDTLIGDYRY
jgi:hypothetical protein